LSKFNRGFFVASFDTQAAIYGARILQRHDQLFQQTRQDDPQITHNHFKVDIMIIATACSINAICLYSEDPHIVKLANGFIDVQPLPVYPEQLSLSDQIF
jgi:hypothetical protein